MDCFIDLIDEKISQCSGFEINLLYSWIIIGAFAFLDYNLSDINDLYTTCRIILTYYIPSINIMFITYIIKFNHKHILIMIALIISNITIYYWYLKNFEKLWCVIVAIIIFGAYLLFMSKWIGKCNVLIEKVERNSSCMNKISG